jgi:hypothetical protein
LRVDVVEQLLMLVTRRRPERGGDDKNRDISPLVAPVLALQ